MPIQIYLTFNLSVQFESYKYFRWLFIINQDCLLQYNIVGLLLVRYSIIYIYICIQQIALYFKEISTLVAGYSVNKMFGSLYFIMLGKHVHFVIQYVL
jgi:hypothetical protein